MRALIKTGARRCKPYALCRAGNEDTLSIEAIAHYSGSISAFKTNNGLVILSDFLTTIDIGGNVVR